MNETLNRTCGHYGLLACEYLPLYAIPVVIISVLTIGGNMFNLFVLSFTQGMHNNPGYFMMSLAVTDLCVGIIMAGFMAPRILYGDWPSSKLISDTCAFFIQTVVSVSVITLTALSFDRFLNISRPLHYDNLMTKRRCIAVIFTTWLITGILQLPPILFGWGEFFYDCRSYLSYYNYADSWQWTVGYNLLFTVPCLVIIFTCHFKIFRITRRHLKAINQTSIQTNNKRQNSNKAMRTVVVTITMFFICWTPFCFEQLSYSLSEGRVKPWPQEVHMLLLLLILSNSFMNCIIYSTTHRTFRNGAKRLIFKLIRRVSRQVEPYEGSRTIMSSVSASVNGQNNNK